MATDNEQGSSSPQQVSGGGAPLSTTNNFTKGMLKDYNESFIGDGLYTHARNAVNSSHDGQIGTIGNEPSNLFCVRLPYDLIGCIPTVDDIWVVYTTDDIDSEIGLFDESACTYTKIVNSPCLNFKRSNLITGAFRKRYDCERVVYWDDGLNPSRTMNIDTVPFKYTIKNISPTCTEKVFTNELDCEAIRIAPLITHPCISLNRGRAAGTLPNGSYQACIAYTVNQVKVTDYIGLSQVQSLFVHENVSSSLDVTIENIDKDFDEFELVILSNINGQAVAKRIGYYSTAQGTIYIDRWDLEFVTVPISDIVLRTDPAEKSDAMYPVNTYLLRVGTYSKYKFNYQPFANKIVTNWVAVEYPADYYVKGGNNTGYLRDEQYAFFIRWIYNTGERSDSYHIPGRAPSAEDTDTVSGTDAFETIDGIAMQKWQVENTASVQNLVPETLPDGGVVIGTGRMAYWESTEKYPSDKFEIWDSLCGKNIRHHKMPDFTVDPIVNHFNPGGSKIVILGVRFSNITHPVDQNGNPVESVVGYEVLRGSREGAKSIVAKGMFNNMREYKVPGNDTIRGLYQNYPYNDLRPDPYLTEREQTGTNGPNNDKPSTPPLSTYKQDIFSFHSPEVSFSFPYLNIYETKLYQELTGTVDGSFSSAYLHPKFKLITNLLDTTLDTFATAIQVIQSTSAVVGGYELDLSVPTSDLPGIKVGIPQVLAEGAAGVFGNAAAAVAVGVNIAFQAAYVAFFGIPLTKQVLLNIVINLIPSVQLATQYNSHSFYNNSAPNILGNQRRKVTEANYVGSSMQQFGTSYQVNNINRNKFLALQLNTVVANPTTVDNSRFLLSTTGRQLNNPISSTTSSYYGAIKIAIPSQYGQLDSVKQLVISDCIFPTVAKKNYKSSTGVIFGGDTYIGRFTEKNSMFFFNSWLMGEPDNYLFNYTLYPSLPYPRFWVNNVKYIGIFADRASEYRSLDGIKTEGIFGGLDFFVSGGYFYLFNSGVRDFFVESEVNIAYRDWEDDIAKRHYDPYAFTDLTSMFRSDVIKSGNYYKYDYSLSISKLFNSNITWGNLLPRDYDPTVFSTCYTYRPNRVIYSLPQQDESKKDSWRTFLVNNYRDFLTRVTSVKPINKTGALFMMAYQSPLQFMGTEELKLDGTGVKVTVGDGALFSDTRQLQAIVNADQSYEYGSCQGKYSAIGTSKGVFWVSQNQGKIFQYTGELKEISANGLKWWFAKYLPSQLLIKFPEYSLYDNPVSGVGVQAIYDNTYEILYITKKDYVPKDSNIKLGTDGNLYRGSIKVSLDDERYFEKAHFTISYDTKSQTWISFHDWIPSFLIPGKNHFMSVDLDEVWKHNIRCDSYCNYYGVNYPFEIEFVSSTGQQVNSMRNIEYILEVYKYSNDCRDRFHFLDANFDQAMVYNSEQNSGILNLKLKQKNDPLSLLNYPKSTGESIDIQFSKEENKYRFNQFWDSTKDRGEFSGRTVPMFITKANGYEYDINPAYIDYDKPPLQRKKFRHYVNRVFLRKTISENQKFLFKTSNQKLLTSYR
jgi:hypothetical protein